MDLAGAAQRNHHVTAHDLDFSAFPPSLHPCLLTLSEIGANLFIILKSPTTVCVT